MINDNVLLQNLLPLLMMYFENFLLICMVFLIIGFTFAKNLFDSLIILMIFSFIIMLIYLMMNAPDVAMTEAAVGACITFIFPMLLVSSFNSKDQICNLKFSKKTLFLTSVIAVIMGYIAFLFPEYGQAQNPINQHVSQYYIQNSGADIGIPSMVASILASYRAFDTLGETFVILTAGFGVYLILAKNRNNPETSGVKQDILFKTGLKILAPIIIIFSFYIQFHGEVSPGGGFQSGAMIASLLMLIAIIYDKKFLLEKLSLNLLKNLSIIGALIYAFIGMFAIFAGKNFLDYSYLAENSANAQKIGIFIIELGVAITVFSVLTKMFLIFINATKEAKDDE